MSTDTVSKFYDRESQADLDAREKAKDGWVALVTRYSHAARKWVVVYQLPVSIFSLAMRGVA